MERTKKNRTAAEADNGFVLPSLVCGLIGLGVTGALLLLMPFAILSFDDPSSFTPIAVILSALLGGAVGSLLAAKRCKESQILSSLIVFATMLLPIIVASFFVSGEIGVLSIVSVVLPLALGNAAVAFVTARASKSKKRKMKSVMKRR